MFSQVCQDLIRAALQNGPDPLLLQNIIQVAQDGKAVPRRELRKPAAGACDGVRCAPAIAWAHGCGYHRGWAAVF